MPGTGVGAGEPTHLFGCAAAWQHRHLHSLIVVPLIKAAATLQRGHIGDQRKERNDDVFVGDAEVMHHARPRRVKPDFMNLVTLRIEDIHRDLTAAITARLK